MLKKDSCEVKEKIREYLTDPFIDWYEVNKDSLSEELSIALRYTDRDNFSTICNGILYVFFVEAVKHDCRFQVGRITRKELFTEWLSGLCEAVNSSYCNHPIARRLLGDWLEATKEEIESRYTETQAEEMITYLLWKEITSHATTTGIMY